MKILVNSKLSTIRRNIHEKRRVGRIHNFIADLAGYYNLSRSDGIELDSRKNTWHITCSNTVFLDRLRRELVRFPTVVITEF